MKVDEQKCIARGLSKRQRTGEESAPASDATGKVELLHCDFFFLFYCFLLLFTAQKNVNVQISLGVAGETASKFGAIRGICTLTRKQVNAIQNKKL